MVRSPLTAMDPGGEFFWPDNNNWSQARVLGGHPCPPHAAGFVREPSNWTTPDYPNSPSAVVFINSAPAVNLDVAVDVGTLNIAAGNKLRIFGYTQLNVHGGTLTNNGTIDIEDVTSSTARLNVAANTLLTGTEQTRFTSHDDCYIMAPSENELLTIDNNHEVIAIAGTVPGESRFSASFLNNGRVTADQGGVRLDTYNKVNRGLIRVINGGTINFSSVAVDNNNGTITAGETSHVVLDEASVTGGRLNGPGNFDVTSRDATFDKVTLAEGSTVLLGSYDILTVRDTMTNNGTIKLDDVGSSHTMP